MRCVECVVSADCTALMSMDGGDPDARICAPDNTCVQCLMAADCASQATAHMCRDDHECVECLQDTDCAPGLRCSRGGNCRAPRDGGMFEGGGSRPDATGEPSTDASAGGD
jgi:hypothetical protein